MKKILTILLTIVLSIAIVFCVKYFQIKNQVDNSDSAALVEKIKDLTSRLDEKNTLTEELNENINELNNEILKLNNQIKELENSNSEKDIEIAKLNSQKSELQKSYDNLVKKFNELNSVVLTFMVDEQIFDVVVTTKGSIITPKEPSSTDVATFKGWSEDGITLFDFTTTISENKTFTAIFDTVQTKYTVGIYDFDKFTNAKKATIRGNLTPLNVYLYIDTQFKITNEISPTFGGSDNYCTLHFIDLSGDNLQFTIAAKRIIGDDPSVIGITYDSPFANPNNPNTYLKGFEYLQNMDFATNNNFAFDRYYSIYATYTVDDKVITTSAITSKITSESVIAIDFTEFCYLSTIQK